MGIPDTVIGTKSWEVVAAGEVLIFLEHHAPMAAGFRLAPSGFITGRRVKASSGLHYIAWWRYADSSCSIHI
jgi:hypothetical protein